MTTIPTRAEVAIAIRIPVGSTTCIAVSTWDLLRIRVTKKAPSEAGM